MDSTNFSREPMLEMFIFESNQLLEQLEELLLNSEKSNSMSMESINEIFRIMHTVKGSSAMMMYNNISSIAHAIEDLFFYVREHQTETFNYTKVCDIVLASSDFIKEEITKIEEGRDADADEYALVERIRAVLDSTKDNKNETATVEPIQIRKSSPSKFYISASTMLSKTAKNKFIAHIFFEDGCQMENIRAFTVYHNLKDLCAEILHRPKDLVEDPHSSEYIVRDGFKMYFSSDANDETVRNIIESALFVKNYEMYSVDSYENEVADLREKTDACYMNTERENKKECNEMTEELHEEVHDEKDNTTKSIKKNLISVNVLKLDKLMDLVGEIVISESMVTKNTDLAGLELENFSKAARQLRKLTDELQDIVMSIRMIPIAATFQKMQRIVRDMGKKLHKEAELVIIGEETEVDKNIIDNISDPLMHLIRNAMDHGIENTEERIQNGKPTKGEIKLVAKNTGGDVVISVSDDGKGLNKEKIMKKAMENGLVNKPEHEYSDKEIFSFIILPGFSTKENVTEFSGRGVGMDVVKKNIEKVGGIISVDSKEGKGTTISIKIPLTLAIIDGMEIAVGKAIYTLPTIAIKESFRPEQKSIIHDTEGREMMMLRGNCYPIIRLHQVYGVDTAVTALNEGIIVVMESETRTVCLFADRLIGEQQVVVKPLPQYLLKYTHHVNGIGGCTILGDGNISLILDPMSMISHMI